MQAGSEGKSKEIVLRLAAATAIFLVGPKCLVAFIDYSFALGAWHGLTANAQASRSAVVWQVLSLVMFLATQVLGGVMLRSLLRRAFCLPEPLEKLRASALLNYTISFGSLTIICAIGPSQIWKYWW